MHVSPRELKELAKFPLNGRQIKSAIKTAQELALGQEKPLGLEQLRIVLELRMEMGKMLGLGQDAWSWAGSRGTAEKILVRHLLAQVRRLSRASGSMSGNMLSRAGIFRCPVAKSW